MRVARWERRAVVAALAVGLATLPVAAASADPEASPTVVEPARAIDVGPEVRGAILPVRLDVAAVPSGHVEELELQSAGAPIVGASGDGGDGLTLGTQRTWLGLDLVAGQLYPKPFVLRGGGEHVEVWVALDLSFPAGDCRNDGQRDHVTTEQVQHLVEQFEDVILPQSAATLSVAPRRNGSMATLPAMLGLPPGTFASKMARTVVLVDNIRDTSWSQGATAGANYVAGFSSPHLGDMFDRNVVTLDSWDWAHRVGPNPPSEPTDDPCTSAAARPWLYEGVLAHEHEHLLESAADPDEATWLDEGMAEWAKAHAGYTDPAAPLGAPTASPQIQCFLGASAHVETARRVQSLGGPGQSLTQWGDQGEEAMLCDYGAATTFVQLLHARFGDAFVSALHRGPANGLAGVEEALVATGHAGETSATGLVHEWAVAMALDGPLDDNGGWLLGATAVDRQVPTLHAAVDWDVPGASAGPGAPPNGSDYVRPRDADGVPLLGRQITSLAFRGASVVKDDDGPATVDGWHVTVVLTSTRRPWLTALEVPLPLDDRFELDGATGAASLLARLDGRRTSTYDQVGVVITHDDPDEDLTVPAPYRLEINGVRQAGGH